MLRVAAGRWASRMCPARLRSNPLRCCGVQRVQISNHLRAAPPLPVSSAQSLPMHLCSHSSDVCASKTTTVRGFASAAAASSSPLMDQYFEHKSRYPDYVLFMRVGDFYEFFHDDAVIASRALDIVLTKRSNVPMAGVPVHLLNQYLGKLVKQGFKAAICDQVETAAEARRRKGIIKRDIVRLITPGTITDDFANSETGQTNYLACILEQHPGQTTRQDSSTDGTAAAPFIGISWLDICSGEFLVATARSGEEVEAYLAWMPPSELLVEPVNNSDGPPGSRSSFQRRSVVRRLLAENRLSCPVTELGTLDGEKYSSSSGVESLGRYEGELDLSANPSLIARVLGSSKPRSGVNGQAEALSGLEFATAAALLGFVDFTQKGESFVLQPARRVSTAAHLFIDAASRMSLNLTTGTTTSASTLAPTPGSAEEPIMESGPSRTRRRSLANMIDRTATSMGARLLFSRLASPLTDVVRIDARLNNVDFFRQRGCGAELARIRQAVSGSADAERALQRLSLGRGSPSDLVGVASSMCRGIEALEAVLGAPGGTKLTFEIGDTAENLLQRLKQHAGTFKRITKYIRPTVSGGFNSAGQLYGGGSGGPAAGRRGAQGTGSGGAERREIVRRGWSPEVDRLIDLRSNIKGLFRDLERRYRTDIGVGDALKIKFNQALGYHLDVPARLRESMEQAIARSEAKSGEDGSRLEFLPVQPTRAAMRYKTNEILALEQEAEDAQRQLLLMEFAIFSQLRDAVLGVADVVLATSKFVAEVDVAQSTAQSTAELGLVRPHMIPIENNSDSSVLEIDDCRHLLVEDFCLTRGTTAFVPNDVSMTQRGRDNCWFVTGPNMGGKSTFLRSVAHAVCLAQAGFFVPARSARIGVVDQLFSRVGASDDLSQGKSTFLVEMEETALILNRARPQSLVIVDEIGRGTSHKEGYAIAGAVLEELCGWQQPDHLEEGGDNNRSSGEKRGGIGCRALFATHYHDLLAPMIASGKAFTVEDESELESQGQSLMCVTPQRPLPGLQQFTMETISACNPLHPDDEVTIHTHRVVRGSANSSYAMSVAKTANLPPAVCARAAELLHALESELE